MRTPKSWLRDITSLTEKDVEDIQKNVILSLIEELEIKKNESACSSCNSYLASIQRDLKRDYKV